MQKNRIFSIISILITLSITLILFFVSQNYFKIPSAYFVILFFISLFIITMIYQKRNNCDEYKNPYVDIKKYKFPLNFLNIPPIDFPRFKLQEDEKLLFVCETCQQDNQGNLVITTKRVKILNLQENSSINVDEITNVESISTCAIRITTQKEKFYIIVNKQDVEITLKILNIFLK